MYPGVVYRARVSSSWCTLPTLGTLVRTIVSGVPAVPHGAAGRDGKDPPVKDLPILAWVTLPGVATLPRVVSSPRRNPAGKTGRVSAERVINWIAEGQNGL